MLLRRTSEICIFYTDMHDVDEDVRTIMIQGSGWANVIDSGVFIRGMDDDPVSLVNVVASSNVNN